MKPDMIPTARMRESVRLVQGLALEGVNVLDIGCGFGWFEHGILSEPVRQVVALEHGFEGITTAANNISDERANFAVGGALRLPFVDGAFDVVVSWEVLEHIPRDTEGAMFSEVARVLRPGGRFAMSTPFESRVSKVLDPAWWVIGHRHYSEHRIGQFAEAANLRLVESARRGGTWSVLAMLDMYVCKWVLRRKPIFENWFAMKEATEYLRPDGIATLFAMFEKGHS